MRQPDLISKWLSIIIVIIFLGAFGLSAYLPSTLRGKINPSNFTVSQSLAFSIKIVFLVLMTVAIGLLGYLIYYRGHNYILFRIFLIIAMYAFVISILWVTTYYNKQYHYTLAAIIFILASIYIILNSYVISNGLSSKTKTNYNKLLILKIIPLLVSLGLIGLIVGNVPAVYNNVPEIFPSFENYVLFIQGLSILTLGFF
jgi:hypothetical protein